MGALTVEEKYRVLTEIADETHDEIIDNVNRFGKVFVVRPTGFGKTRMFVRLAKEYYLAKKKKILYVYPLDIIVTEIHRNKEYMTDTRKEGNKNVKYSIIDEYVTFISYAAMTRRINEFGEAYWHDFLENEYSLILVDEAHRAGSEGFTKVYESIKDLIGPDKIHLVGATATPNRMDDTEEKSVLDSIFDGICISEFNYPDAVKRGIMQRLILATRIYNTESLAKAFKAKKMAECRKSGHRFDEDSYNVELAKALREYGDEPQFLYKYIKKAGYNVKDPSQSYFKFIVFCTNIAELAEKGPMVEEWFSKAFNVVAKSEENLRKDFEVFSYYVASSDTPEGDLESLVTEKSVVPRKFFKKTSKLNDVSGAGRSRAVDLIFTVNMINMGYHVEDITGIVMLRGTKSEIVWMQQLGRCISVKAERSPIVYDFVNNSAEKFWSKKNAKSEIEKALGVGVGGTDPDGSGTKIVDDPDMLFVEGDEDVFEDFLRRWDKDDYSEISGIKWMYTERKAPISVIASDTGKSCSEVVKELVMLGVKLRSEDAEYERVLEKEGEKSQRFIYLFSVKAVQLLRITGFKGKTIFDTIKKLVRA